MKDLIKKILREEVQRRFIKSNQSFERLIIKQMESLISETNRVVVPPEENYGNYTEEWCKGDKIIMQARYFFSSEDSDEEKFFGGDLYVNKEEIDFLSQMLQVRKPYLLNVITEWYDEKYATKFGQETGHPELEIDETHETDSDHKCYKMINTSNLSREYMVDYIDTNTLYKLSELEKLPDDELERRYRSVYNIQLNK
jgi:hypothetical protein